MQLDERVVRELTQAVWSSLVGLDVQPIVAPQVFPDLVVASVDIAGDWEGSVALSCSGELGRQLTLKMLSCAATTATPALVRDVVGELVNIVGGNIKGLLPGPCRLSLPRVEAEWLRVSGAEPGQRLWFVCAGQPFSVTLALRPSGARSES